MAGEESIPEWVKWLNEQMTSALERLTITASVDEG